MIYSLEKLPMEYFRALGGEKVRTTFYYTDSVHESCGVTVMMIHDATADQLLLIAQKPNEMFNAFEGTVYPCAHGRHQVLKLAPRTQHNAAALRKYFPWTAPVPVLRKKCSIGCGDRLGNATPFHAQLFKKWNAAPVFAQQSVRELTLTGRTFRQVIDDASFGVFQAGYKDGFGADGDHLKRFEHIQDALDAGVTMLTLDLSDELHPEYGSADLHEEEIEKAYGRLPGALRARLEKMYLATPVQLKHSNLCFSRLELMRCALIYTQAMDFAAKVGEMLTKHGADKIDLEVSIDETTTPTLPEHHYFVASELIYRGVRFESLAPRFAGEFQKGIDYIGDPAEFERQLKQHVEIADTFGSYKISVHSGSDKFSVFPAIGCITGGHFHLKTAGTSWLEACHAIALTNPALFRKMVERAFETLPEACKYYHVTADFDSLPDPEDVPDKELKSFLECVPGRQLLHITYGFMLGSGAELRTPIYHALNTAVSVYGECLREHFEKHFSLLDIPLRNEHPESCEINMAQLAGMEQKTFTAGDGTQMGYCQYISHPELPGRYSLILLMHGVGSIGHENWTHLRAGATEIVDYLQRHHYKVVFIAPQCPEDGLWVETVWGAPSHVMAEKPSKPFEHALELLDSKIQEFQVDPTRIYISGNSMGGFCTWEMLQRRPGFFAAAMPVCGGADLRFANALKNEHILVFHGDSDTSVLPSRSRDMVRALEKAGNKTVRYVELPGVGHNAWDYAFVDESLDWMMSQRLDTKNGDFPKQA